jgi:hypothetical protein
VNSVVAGHYSYKPAQACVQLKYGIDGALHVSMQHGLLDVEVSHVVHKNTNNM